MKEARFRGRDLLRVAAVSTVLFFVAFTAYAGDDPALLAGAKQVFAPLPPSMPSDQNPITREKVRLGRMLFHEMRISVDGTVSCHRCHPISLYGADGLRKSVGNNCRVNPRNAPTIFNAASQISAHWIGNRRDVEDQARQSVTGPPAFGMPSDEAVEKRLKDLGYGPFFREAFPEDSDPVRVDNLAKAIGAFERTLVTPSPFDGYLKGAMGALTDKQKKGLKTFMDTGCATCHAGAYVGGQMYRKFGVTEPYWKYTKTENVDEGRFAVTKDESDKYFFKVPVLRNVAKTSPYFHDGSVDRLEKAVEIMAKVQLGKELEKTQVEEIVSFLGSLTGEIPEDVLRAPLLP